MAWHLLQRLPEMAPLQGNASQPCSELSVGKRIRAGRGSPRRRPRRPRGQLALRGAGAGARVTGVAFPRCLISYYLG
jgi:hypothetical protein